MTVSEGTLPRTAISNNHKRDLGIAVSGGGFRAVAFGLGCLRALHDLDLLSRARVISGISGGSLLIAAYAYGPEHFSEFDEGVVALLRHGLQAEILRRTTTPSAVGSRLVATTRRLIEGDNPSNRQPRRFNRTNALIEALADLMFGETLVDQATTPGLATIISSTDLRTTNAVRFGSERSACSRYGVIKDPVTVAEAVAASAAYPLLLPPLERQFLFNRDNRNRVETVLLTDGGVYDNLGLTPLERGRSASHTEHTYDVDFVLACDAGRGLPSITSGRRMPRRLQRSFEITYRRAQDATRARLFEDRLAQRIRGFAHVYLGTVDERIPTPMEKLGNPELLRNYPTDFRAMRQEAIDMLAARAEQLTRVLIEHYCPELL